MEFEHVQLKELCISITDCPHSTPKWTESGELVIRNFNIKNGRLDLSKPSFTNKVDFEKRRSRAVPLPGDLIITREAPMGEVCRIPQGINCCLGQRMVLLKPNPERVDGRYLLCAIMSSAVQNQIAWSEGTGSTVSNLRIPHLERLNIPYVDLPTQRRIASTLSALDEKIAVNERINANLQEQAIALFTSSYETASIIVPFTSIVQVLSGGTPKTDVEQYWNGEIAFFTPKDVGTPFTLKTEKYISDVGLAHCNSKLYPTYTTFVTARGTVGKVSMAGYPMAMNQSCYALGGINIHPLLVYCYTLQVIDSLKHNATGAVFDAITVRDFSAETIHRIDNATQNKLICVLEPIFSAILANSNEIEQLTTLRDTLLPKLMSGEIDVSDVVI